MKVKGKEYLHKENAARSERYSKNVTSENYFFRFNEYLTEFDKKLQIEQPSNELPLVLVVGLPRSGTTLLMQWLTRWMSLGYVNNIMAKFWLAPLAGYRFSEDLVNREVENYSSDFGKTDELSAPHEFSYFWINWLGITNDPPYDPVKARAQIDWKSLTTIIQNLQVYAQSGFIFKGLHPIRHIGVLKDYFPNLVVVYIKRDPIEVAHSLKKARISYYGDPNHWWSMVTPNYNEILDLPYYDQIPIQMKTMHDEFENNISLLNPENVIQVRFDSFLENPSKVLNELESRLSTIKPNINFRNGMPKSNFRFSRNEMKDFDADLARSVKNVFPV